MFCFGGSVVAGAGRRVSVTGWCVWVARIKS